MAWDLIDASGWDFLYHAVEHYDVVDGVAGRVCGVVLCVAWLRSFPVYWAEQTT